MNRFLKITSFLITSTMFMVSQTGHSQTTFGASVEINANAPQEFTVSGQPPIDPPPGESLTTVCSYGYAVPGHWDWQPIASTLSYDWAWNRPHCETPQAGYVYVDPYWGTNSYGSYIYRPGFFVPQAYYSNYYRVSLFTPTWYRPYYHPVFRPYVVRAPGYYSGHYPGYRYPAPVYRSPVVRTYPGQYPRTYPGPVYHPPFHNPNPGPIPPHIPHSPVPRYSPAPHYAPATHSGRYGAPAYHGGFRR